MAQLPALTCKGPLSCTPHPGTIHITYHFNVRVLSQEAVAGHGLETKENSSALDRRGLRVHPPTRRVKPAVRYQVLWVEILGP